MAASVAVRSLSLFLPVLDLDEASYLAAAHVLTAGGTLYVDVADHHPPGAWLIYAAALSLLGPGIAPLRFILAFAVVPLTALGLWRLAKKGAAGVAAGVIYSAWSASFLAHDMWSVNCEFLFLLPAVWALPLCADDETKGGPFIAGVLFGVAALIKYQGAMWWPLAAWLFVRRRNWFGFAGLALGFVAVIACALLAFARAGTLTEFLYWNIEHNLKYAANVPPLREVAERVASSVLPFALLAGVPLWICRRALRTIVGVERIVILSAAFLALAAASLGLRFYPHYLIPFYVPLALSLGRAWEGIPNADKRVFRGALVGVPVLTFLANCVVLASGRRSDVIEELDPIFRSVATTLTKDPCFEKDRATLFTWGYAPIFYSETGLPPASRFLFVETTLSGYTPGNRAALGDATADPELQNHHLDLLLGDLERNAATYIIDTAPAGIHHFERYPLSSVPRLFQYVRERYELVEAPSRVAIYRRLGCEAATQAK